MLVPDMTPEMAGNTQVSVGATGEPPDDLTSDQKKQWENNTHERRKNTLIATGSIVLFLTVLAWFFYNHTSFTNAPEEFRSWKPDVRWLAERTSERAEECRRENR